MLEVRLTSSSRRVSCRSTAPGLVNGVGDATIARTASKSRADTALTPVGVPRSASVTLAGLALDSGDDEPVKSSGTWRLES